MKIVLFRKYQDNCTIGNAIIHNDDDTLGFAFKTLELPWLNNAHKISCIPEGIYKCKKNTWQPHFGNHFDILNVPGRAGVKIHSGNYTSQILGCILAGQSHVDINHDGIVDITNSKDTLAKVFMLMPDEFTLEIKKYI